MNAMLAAILSERTHVDRHLKKNGCALFSSLSQIGKEWQGEREGEKGGTREWESWLMGNANVGGGATDRVVSCHCSSPSPSHTSTPFLALSVSLWAMSFDVLGIICLKCVRAL